MRPPVAAEDGNSPLRSKNAKHTFNFAAGMKDPAGFRVTREQVINNFTDDGKLTDTRWNSRHHRTASQYNKVNFNFYKQYFDKGHKQTEAGKIRELS